MLELRDLHFVVDRGEGPEGGKRGIINGINFNFEKGKFYAVTGPNGSGKTTLAKLIMGINPTTSGSIIFEGKDITGYTITERANAGIAYSFQQPARFKGITFRELLSLATGIQEEDRLIALLMRVGICPLDFLDKAVDAKLSGGEIKKIELATTIARNPKLAIYDEPDTGIDLWTIGPMVDLLKREQKEYETTTIVVSHNKVFLEAADEVLIINGGQIVFHGRIEEALPLLNDLSICNFKACCEGEEHDVRCFR
jgi:Fe-S cluster assembly ATP-binding protein